MNKSTENLKTTEKKEQKKELHTKTKGKKERVKFNLTTFKLIFFSFLLFLLVLSTISFFVAQRHNHKHIHIDTSMIDALIAVENEINQQSNLLKQTKN